ncbi:MAG: WD40 repeat domain-containing protein, partial [Planctomycetales bacterium]|nr:WD40 repeat domain-containing protein [Planctomycetales bacterium]
ERYLRGEPVAARPIGIIEQRWRWCCRNPMLAATSILALLLLLATLIVSLSFAYREATARMATEQSRMREVAMRKIAATERANAESQYRVAQQALATLYTHNGIWASQADLDGDALLWFARAAQLEGIDDVSSKMNGQRCHSWLHSSPIPVSTHWFDVSGIDDITRNWSLWQMCPNQPFLTFKSNGQFGVWNYKNDEIWRPSNELWCVASASWNEHGDRLALGCHTGHTHVVDSFSKTLLATYILDAPVVHVTFFGTGTQLAIATQRSVAVADFDSESTVRVIYNVEEGNIASVVVAPDNDTVAISTTDGTVALVSLSADAGTLISQIEGLHYDQQTANLNFLPVFSADSSRIIVRSRPRTVEVFDVGMGTSVSRRLLTEEEFAFAVSADRRRCAVGGDTYARPLTLRWSPDRVEMIRHNLRLVHQDAVTDLCFGGNDLIATCGQNQQVKLWSLKGQSSKTGRYNERAIPLATLAHTERVVGMRMGVSADTLITVQRDGLARVWQVPDFKPPGYYVQTNRGGSTIRLLDQGHWIIAGTTHWDGHVVRSSVRRTKDGMVFAETPQRHLSEMGAVLDTGISTDASILVSLHSNPHRSADTIITEAEYAGSIQLWQLPGGAAIGQAIRTSAEPRSVVILPGATTAAVLLADWRVVFVDFARCEIDRTIEPDDTMVVRNVDAAGRPTELFNGRLEYRGDAMVSWGLGTGLHVYDPSGKRLKCRTEFARQWDIRNLALSPDGATIALSTSSDRLMLINSNNGQILQELIHSSPIESISFSADAKIVLTGSLDGRVRMFYVATGERKGTDLVHNDGVLDAVVSPDYTCLAALTMDRRIIVWDVATGMWGMRPIVAPIGTKRVLFSSDSRYLLTMGIGTECLVCDLAEAMQSCDDLQRATLVGELLSGKRASNEMDNLTSEQWLQRWQAFQGISK